MASHNRTIYIGVTNDLQWRTSEHKSQKSGFTARYRVTNLVYVEQFASINEAIAREKQIKGWTRAKKIALIEEANHGWHDLQLPS